MKQNDLYVKAGYWTFLVTLVANLLFFAYISFLHPGIPKNPGENYGTESSP